MCITRSVALLAPLLVLLLYRKPTRIAVHTDCSCQQMPSATPVPEPLLLSLFAFLLAPRPH